MHIVGKTRVRVRVRVATVRLLQRAMHVVGEVRCRGGRSRAIEEVSRVCLTRIFSLSAERLACNPSCVLLVHKTFRCEVASVSGRPTRREKVCFSLQACVFRLLTDFSQAVGKDSRAKYHPLHHGGEERGKRARGGQPAGWKSTTRFLMLFLSCRLFLNYYNTAVVFVLARAFFPFVA